MSQPSSYAAGHYSPLYFLASLGSGGLTVTFFMYLMFWVDHPDQQVPLFSDILLAFGSGPLPLKAAIIVAWIGIAVFAFLNLRLLFWNLSAYRSFIATPAYEKLRNSNAETQILAMPLAMAMSVNAGFILGMVFVPGLWSIVEYLFPMAMVVFAAIGGLALWQIGRFLGRILSHEDAFDARANNSFAQVLPAFALSMVAVGLAAPAAMSGVKLTVSISLLASLFFGTLAILYMLAAGTTGLVAMLRHGVAREGAPTLMVIVPTITVLSIMAMRQNHGLHSLFGAHSDKVDTLVFLTQMLSIQFAFLGAGLLVLRQQKYGAHFIFGGQLSAGAYALICPGVGVSVLLQFWINKGLVGAGIISDFSIAYWLLTTLPLIAQATMIWLVWQLNRRHFGRGQDAGAVPAE